MALAIAGYRQYLSWTKCWIFPGPVLVLLYHAKAEISYRSSIAVPKCNYWVIKLSHHYDWFSSWLLPNSNFIQLSGWPYWSQLKTLFYHRTFETQTWLFTSLDKPTERIVFCFVVIFVFQLNGQSCGPTFITSDEVNNLTAEVIWNENLLSNFSISCCIGCICYAWWLL